MSSKKPQTTMNIANQNVPGAPESGILPTDPVGLPHPLVRPSGVGWWWVLHRGHWRCGRVIEDREDDASGSLIWSDGGAWYCVARINVDLMTGTHWFPATPPDWPNNQVEAQRPGGRLRQHQKRMNDKDQSKTEGEGAAAG